MSQAQGGYRVRDPYAIYFVTFTVVEWMDVFTRPEYAQYVLDSLRFSQEQRGLMLYGWVLMPNHLHLIVQVPEGGRWRISDFVRDFKGYTGKRLVPAIVDNPQESRRRWMNWIFTSNGKRAYANDEIQFWQYGYHPVELTTEERFFQRLEYIHLNPIRTGLVRQPEHYAYSSAIDFAGGKGLLDIVHLKG